MKVIRSLLLLLIACSMLTACGDDRSLEYTDRTEVNQWIYAKMVEYYLYTSTLKEPTGNAWYAVPENFFQNFRVSAEARGGIYTSELFLGPEISATSFGYIFDYQAYDSLPCLRILYVAPQSPASEAGLKRGDWILGYNGQKISNKNYSQLSEADLGAHSLTIGYGTEISIDGPVIEQEQTVSIAAPRLITSTPFQKDTVLNCFDRKIGYLMYTRFEADAEQSDTYYGAYNDELRLICAQFAAEGIKELVLDLRFATGNNPKCAQLLGTMLVPASALDQLFYFNLYNNRTDAYYTASSILGNGANLNLSSLYVITSSRTTHVAEMLIHCLSPYMRVINIGLKTNGLDLFTENFMEETYGYTLKLATSIVYNSDTTAYSGGIVPSVAVSEKDSLLYSSLPFGDPKELMLQETLSVMKDSINF